MGNIYFFQKITNLSLFVIENPNGYYWNFFFNIFQNSVKYNKYSGKIIINFKMVAIPKVFEEEKKGNYTLITEIIDTGIGIGKEK